MIFSRHILNDGVLSLTAANPPAPAVTLGQGKERTRALQSRLQPPLWRHGSLMDRGSIIEVCPFDIEVTAPFVGESGVRGFEHINAEELLSHFSWFRQQKKHNPEEKQIC